MEGCSGLIVHPKWPKWKRTKKNRVNRKYVSQISMTSLISVFLIWIASVQLFGNVYVYLNVEFIS